jgi:hypothetical protein
MASDFSGPDELLKKIDGYVTHHFFVKKFVEKVVQRLGLILYFCIKQEQAFALWLSKQSLKNFTWEIAL